jgi:molybdenum cofactor guanylyltransferase
MNDDVTLAILAGGASSRMGRPKAELELAGRPVLEHLLDAAGWRGPTMLVIAPNQPAPRGAAGFQRVVADARPGEGPLRGVLTALQNATTVVVVVATVDMPGVGSEQLNWVARKLMSDGRRLGLMLRRAPMRAGDESIEPFPSAYRTTAAKQIVEQLEQRQQRAVHSLLEIDGGGFAAVDAPGEWPASVWANLNTPEDLERFNSSP